MRLLTLEHPAAQLLARTLLRMGIIGERERANLVVRFERNFHSTTDRRRTLYVV